MSSEWWEREAELPVPEELPEPEPEPEKPKRKRRPAPSPYEGLFVQASGERTMYVVEGGVRRRFRSQEAMHEYGLRKLVRLPVTELEAIPEGEPFGSESGNR